MNIDQPVIILMGFKHVGKSAIGKALASKLNRPFIDLDLRIELLYEMQTTLKSSCRIIMQTHGEAFFRQLEHQALKEAIQAKPTVISLGGGTPLYSENEILMQPHCVIHIEAPRGIVFERIMASGRPAFFSPEKNPFETFITLWEEREQTYQRCRNFSIQNDASIEYAVQQIMQHREIIL